MLEDLSIPRIFPSHATDSISWNQDGVILIFSRDDLTILNPKTETTTSPNGQQSQQQEQLQVTEKIGNLQDLFKVSRLSSALQQTTNILNVALVDDEIVRLGQCNRDFVTNLSNANCNIIELNWSATRVDFNTQRCLLSYVTDSLNGIIAEYKEGKFVQLINVSEQLGDVDAGACIMTKTDIKKLRIRSIFWLEDVSVGEPPIWPVVVGSMLVCFSESDKHWIYQVDSKNVTLRKVLQFSVDLDVEHDEYVNKCKVSGWINDDGCLVCYFAVSTSFKRIILKRILFDVREKSLIVDELFEKVLLGLGPKQGVISNFEFSQVIKNTVCLSILSTGKLDCVLLNGKSLEIETISTKLLSLVSFSSIVHYKEPGQDIVSILLSNAFKDLLHYKLSIVSKSLISVKKFEYNKKILNFEIPLINKLNEINRINKFRINSMCIDPSGNYLALLYSIYEPNNAYLDTRIRRFHEEVFVTIVPVHKNKSKQEVGYIGVNPHLIVQELKLNEAFHNRGDMDVDTQTNMIVDAELEPSSEFKYDNAIDNLQYELFLRPEVEDMRKRNIIYGCKLMDTKILRLLAKTIIKLVEGGLIAIVTDYDKLAYCKYLRLTNTNTNTNGNGDGNKASDSVVKFAIPGFDEEYETVSLNEMEDSIESIVSKEGHEWKLCRISLLPLVQPKVRKCTYCGSRILALEEDLGQLGQLVEVVVGGLRVCVFCGGCYD